jgi:hypothetical protein
VPNSSSESTPAARKRPYTSGDAWPFEKTIRSFAGLFGSSKS